MTETTRTPRTAQEILDCAKTADRMARRMDARFILDLSKLDPATAAELQRLQDEQADALARARNVMVK